MRTEFVESEDNFRCVESKTSESVDVIPSNISNIMNAVGKFCVRGKVVQSTHLQKNLSPCCWVFVSNYAHQKVKHMMFNIAAQIHSMTDLSCPNSHYFWIIPSVAFKNG